MGHSYMVGRCVADSRNKPMSPCDQERVHTLGSFSHIGTSQPASPPSKNTVSSMQ